MKTIYHSFDFDTHKKEGRDAWAAFVAAREADGIKKEGHGLHRMKSLGSGSYCRPELDGREIELETKFLFANQWNTAPIEGISEKGLRVFDWAQDYLPNNKWLKRGHWLEQTDEMRAARARRWACGYTGKQIDVGDLPTVPDFNLDALESQYLQESELHLIRFHPIMSEEDRAPLTEAERAYLLPLYREAQTYGRTERGKARAAKKRTEIDHKRDVAIDNANTEWKGFDFLLRHGVNTDNAIFYNHTGRFCFGWRKPLSAGEKAALLEAIGSEFPVDYDIKSEPGA